MSDHSDARIDWTGEVPDADVIAKVRAELASDLCDLDKPEDLVFHTVILTDSFDGPSVHLTGNPATGGFTAGYSEKTKWTSINEMLP